MDNGVENCVEGTRLRNGRVALKEITNVTARDRRKPGHVRRVSASTAKCCKRTAEALPCVTGVKKRKPSPDRSNCSSDNNREMTVDYQQNKDCCQPAGRERRRSKRDNDKNLDSAMNFEEKCKLSSCDNNRKVENSQCSQEFDKSVHISLKLTEDYHRDVHSYLLELEKRSPLPENHLYGKKITSKMRCIVIDWLFEVQNHFRLCDEAVELTVTLLDRCLADDPTIDQSNVQLVCLAALFISIKYEETFILELSDLRYICDYSFSEKDILEMEIKVLRIVDFNLSFPSKTTFLGLILYKNYMNDYLSVEKLSKYLIDLSILDCNLASVEPSRVASSSFYLALCVIRGSMTQSISYVTAYSILDLQPTILSIARKAISSIVLDKGGIFNKYFKDNRGKCLKQLVQSQSYSQIITQICATFQQKIESTV